MTTLDSPSTILKNGETSKITSRENWRKDRKFIVIAMEGEVRGTATRDLSPSRLHHRIVYKAISELGGKRNERCNRARLTNEKTKEQN